MKLVVKKNDKVKFVIIPKTNEEYVSVTYGCIRFLDSDRLFSSSLDSLVKTLLDNSHETLKAFKEEIVDNKNVLNFVIEIKLSIAEDKYKKDSIKDFKKDYPENLIILEETSLNYIGENFPNLLKTEFSHNMKKDSTKKLAYLFECFNSLNDYQKPVDNLKKEDFFSKLKNDCPNDKQIERRKEIVKLFNFKNGEEPTHLHLKKDVLILACVFEKNIKVSLNEFYINPLYCVSLPSYTWQCGLK